MSSSGIYLFSNIFSAVIPFLLLPILTRYLNPVEYGEVAMFQTFLAALGSIVGLGAVGAAGRKYYDHDIHAIEFRHYIAACLQVLILSTLLVFIAVYLFRGHFALWMNIQVSWVLWAVFACSAGVVIQLRLGQWQVRQQPFQYGALQVSKGVLDLLFCLLLVVVLLSGSQGRIDALLCATGLIASAALVLLGKDGLLGLFSWKPEYLKDVLRFGLPLLPHTVGIFLLTSMDRFVVNAQLGLADAGVYMVAVQLTAVMALVFDAVNKAYVPWLFERLQRDVTAEKQEIVKLTYIWFAVILLGAALAFILGPQLVILIAGEQYAGAGKVIGWLAMGQAFGGMYLMVTNYIFYSRRTGRLSLATVTSGLINVVLLVSLVSLFGLEGAAIAFAIAMAIRFLLTWWVAHRSHPMPWFDFRGPA
ncbi:lipopolysaccharide biosynthesis protein [Pseudohalioglobus lutimaris]|uniref:Polysaccharide biosynthesis protein n=1 Tax=Pseudohalioglobus lutimaris TaxID=1737061 RepID=A0A2N5X2F7_9GAMM|nr:oligosaccharide flippase family protein [Pseudohalioglobus lutimaris]PLW68658.1 polysaccharide biosynthesis protein [Pseudohalioglobus lutimaris]